MSTTLTNGLKLPDKGSVDWYADMQNNYAILDGAVGTVAEHTTALSGKAPLVHTHTKSDVTDLLNSNFIPSANNSYDLGSSGYQWKSVYAQTYYYNGTEFQNKFVTLDTSQTISGLKYFSSNILHKTPQTIDVSTNPAEVITGKGLQFVDDTQYWGDITPQWTTDGTFRIRIAMTNYNTSGTSTGWFCPLVLDLAKDGSKIDVWSTHLNSNLGTSTNEWNNLYAKNYYYNGVAWGLDKYNQWTGVNDFNNLIGLNGAELWFKQPNIEDITTNPSTDTSESILQIWNRATTQYCGGIINGLMADGTHKLTISCLGFPLNNYGGYYPHSFSFEAKRDGTASFSPNYINASLGTSTNKWKTLNGINPGALSFPNYSDTTYIDISGSIVPPSGQTTINYSGDGNQYTPPVDGWLSIRCDGATFLQIYKNAYNCPGTTASRQDASGKLVVTLPVLKNQTYTIRINTSGTTNVFQLYPCLGNV